MCLLEATLAVIAFSLLRYYKSLIFFSWAESKKSGLSCSLPWVSTSRKHPQQWLQLGVFLDSSPTAWHKQGLSIYPILSCTLAQINLEHLHIYLQVIPQSFSGIEGFFGYTSTFIYLFWRHFELNNFLFFLFFWVLWDLVTLVVCLSDVIAAYSFWLSNQVWEESGLFPYFFF